MDFLLPLYLFKTHIEYIGFATKKQNDVAIKMGDSPLIVVKGISMIDPIYFGDIEIETMQRLNRLQAEIREERLTKKIFFLDIRPEIAERLSRYNFMKYFDRQADITGMQYNFTIESASILFLKGKRDREKIYISELASEIPAYSIITI